MKKFLAFCFAILSTASLSLAAGTPETVFVDTYKKAFEGKDSATLESLLYTKGADPEALDFYKMMMTAEMGSKIEKIELRDLTADEKQKAIAEIPNPAGGKAKLPVTPTKKLVYSVKTEDANGSSTSESESFVALVDGKYLIPVPATVK